MCILYAFTIDQENDQISDLGPPWGLYLSFKKTKIITGWGCWTKTENLILRGHGIKNVPKISKGM